ncbi:hypothetical protein CANARDRAFT_192452 [[Candida] arabinofermentans NRRL YB-2248]|uniref:RINT-1 family protein n=1 Tax=[Candida] arabinofermentans NRRL YB-2248 TaxID=983967 RepID=A0A1E4T2F2_9ASCO|nr:hypothetical protein CANARDRAFT_192452 [[Candida] arabinofermentans NRRL YB-2248]
MTMISQFLESSFSSLADLNKIDNLISSIESSRLALKSQSIDQNGSVKANEQAVELLNDLQEIIEVDDLPRLHDLIDLYGPLEILTSVEKQISDKVQLKQVHKLYEDYESINGQLINFSCIDLPAILENWSSSNIAEIDQILQSFGKFAIQLDDFHTSHEPSSALSNCYSQLQTELSTIVNDKLLKEQLQLILNQSVKDWEEKPITHETLELFSKILQIQSFDPLCNFNENSLWAFESLTNSFKLKFIYHFTGESETNRIDKPEYCLRYLQSYLSSSNIIAKAKFGKSFNKLRLKAPTFESCYIIALLNPLKSKFKKDLKQIVGDERMLSHLIFELQNFDQFIILNYNFNQLNSLLVYSLILSDEFIFNKWLNNEKNFVNHRYDELINSPVAFQIDHDVVEDGKTKPTKSSLNLKNLLEGITKNYENLPIKYQMRFLSEVQLKLLNFYFSVLKQGLDALDKLEKFDEVSYLERLCRLWCSSKFTIEAMSYWGESALFLELWSSLNQNDDLSTTFFDSVIMGYNKDIINRLPKRFDTYFERELNKSMKAYFQANHSWERTDYSENVLLYGSQELDSTILLISKDLKYLQKTLSNSDYLILKSDLTLTISKYFENNIIYSNKFSRMGAKKLKADYLKVIESLNLFKDTVNYGKIMELLQILETEDIEALLQSGEIKVLKDSQVRELLPRREKR